MQPQVSVIVPVYNKCGRIAACIQSVLSQDFNDYELILVDDGSTDGSGAICDSFISNSSDKIKVFHKTNGGVSSARNMGLEKASGQYVCFVDADDTIQHNFISALISVADGYDIVTCSNHQDKEWRGKNIAEYVDTEGRTMLGTAVWGKLYKRSIIENFNLEFDESVAFGEDTLFNLELWAHINSIKAIPVNLYHYNVDILRHYELTAREIHSKIERLQLAYEKIERKYGYTLSINNDINITISLYPLRRCIDNYEEYLSLYKYYYPSATIRDFFNDIRCSPVLRFISQSRSLIIQKGFMGLWKEYKFLGEKYGSYISNIEGRMRGHRIILFLMRYKQYMFCSVIFSILHLINRLK